MPQGQVPSKGPPLPPEGAGGDGGSVQASLTSVYSTGHSTRKATPMVGTRQRQAPPLGGEGMTKFVRDLGQSQGNAERERPCRQEMIV